MLQSLLSEINHCGIFRVNCGIEPCLRPPWLLAGVCAEDVYAVFNGKPLADCELLSLAGVEEEQTLYILGRLLGGGKKRKKKTYTKPKKQKHKHKKIKLRVLKFYKVGGTCGQQVIEWERISSTAGSNGDSSHACHW